MAKCLYESYAIFASGKTYELTGSVVDMRPGAIIVQNGSEKREVVRAPGTKATGNLKVGNKVAIRYMMTAAEVEAKE